MINHKIVLFIIVFGYTVDANCQSLKKLFYSVNDSFIYKRKMVSIYNDEPILDTVKTVVEKLYYLTKTKVMLQVDNFFPLCLNAKLSDTLKICQSEKIKSLIILDLLNRKIYKQELFKGQSNVEVDKDIKRILRKQFCLIDSVFSFENNVETFLNGKKYDFDRVYFMPFVDFQYSKLYVEDEDIEPGIFLWAKFPSLIYHEKDIKTFSRYDMKQGEMNITLGENLLIKNYSYYPNRESVSYEFELISK